MTRVRIDPANLAHASYVTAHLRAADAEEVDCQMPDGVRRHELAASLINSTARYTDGLCAYLDDRPVALFGVSPVNVACYSVWALGTNRMLKAVPAITEHFLRVLGPDLVERGVLCLEARSIASHTQAHRWMHLTGAVRVDPPFPFGKNGEKFVLFRWTTEDFDRITSTRRDP